MAEGISAAFCGRVLSDLGADVLATEWGGSGSLPQSAGSAYLTAGKSTFTGGDGDLRRLIAEADVLVSDLEPERVRRLIGIRHRVGVVCVRPFGVRGRRAGEAATHLTVFHSSGEGSTLPSGPGWERFPERAPVQLGSDIGWFDAGWNAALVAVAILHDRRRGHAGQWADVSVQESILSLNRTRLNRWLNEGVCVGRERSRYGILGMLRCRDGWAQVVGMRDEHWDALVALPGSEAFRNAGFADRTVRAADTEGLGRALTAWCADRSKAEVVELLTGLGVPAGVFADPADLLASEQLAHRGFFESVEDGSGSRMTLPGAPYRFSRTPAGPGPVTRPGPHRTFRPRSAPMTCDRPGRFLEGVRVLDFTWAAAGPYATLLLGFLGAEVVKVESPSRLDPARSGFIARYEGVDRSPIFNEINLNKASVQADLKDPAAISAIKSLAASFDVVVDNFRPGVMARLGLGADDLLALHPQLVVASSSAHGSTGPEAMGAGLASIFAASGGLSTQTGYPDGPPTEVGDPMDYRSGVALALAIAAALVHRDVTGEGQHVDLSSREVTIASAPAALLAHLSGVPWEPRTGNRDRVMRPQDVYPTGDGRWLALSVRDEQDWVALCRLVDRPGRFGSPARAASRRAASAELDAAITEWSTRHTARDGARKLVAAGVPAAAVMSFADLAADEHLADRRAFVEVEHPVLGPQQVMRAPWLIADGPPDVRRAGPLMGADTESFFAAGRPDQR